MKWGVSGLFFFAIDPLDKLSCRRKLKLKSFFNTHSMWKLSEKFWILLLKESTKFWKNRLQKFWEVEFLGKFRFLWREHYLFFCCTTRNLFDGIWLVVVIIWAFFSGQKFLWHAHGIRSLCFQVIKDKLKSSQKNRVHLQISQSRHLFTFSIYGHRYWKCLMSFCLHFSPIAH